MINFLCSKFSLHSLVTAVSLSQAMRIYLIIVIFRLSFKLTHPLLPPFLLGLSVWLFNCDIKL